VEIKKKKSPGSKTTMLGPSNITLDYMHTYNIEMTVHEEHAVKRIGLNGVPVFLVDAFAWLEKNNALHTEGIFRKEGNSIRMRNPWKIFCGMTTIPNECNAHDICSLIKRFFRAIQVSIFDNNENTILKFIETLNEEHVLLNSLFTVLERLPSINFATLAFLMRNLKKVCSYSAENQMTVDNMATIFAPSLFRDDFTHPSMLGTRSRRLSQDNLMIFMRSRNDLQISVVKLLIQHSNLLGCNLFRNSLDSRTPFYTMPRPLNRGGTRKDSLTMRVLPIPVSARPDQPRVRVDSKGEPPKTKPEENSHQTEQMGSFKEETEAQMTEIKVEHEQKEKAKHREYEAEQKQEDFEIGRQEEALDFSGSEIIFRQIVNSKTKKDLTSLRHVLSPASNNTVRPSLAYFQKNNKGFVKQRINHFGRLASERRLVSENDL